MTFWQHFQIRVPSQADDSHRACLELVSVHAPGREDAGMQFDQVPLSCNHTLVASQGSAPNQHSPVRKPCRAQEQSDLHALMLSCDS